MSRVLSRPDPVALTWRQPRRGALAVSEVSEVNMAGDYARPDNPVSDGGRDAAAVATRDSGPARGGRNEVPNRHLASTNNRVTAARGVPVSPARPGSTPAVPMTRQASEPTVELRTVPTQAGPHTIETGTKPVSARPAPDDAAA